MVMRGLFLLLLTCFYFDASCQFRLQVSGTDTESEKVVDKARHDLKWNDAVKDSLAGAKQCSAILFALYSDGYLGATIDSIYISDSVIHAPVTAGQQYRWILLDASLPREIINEAGLRLSLMMRKPVSPQSVSTLMRKLLKWYNDNGYPFARVSLSDVKIVGSSISASLETNKGELVLFDSLVVKGNSKLAHVYLSNYLSLGKDDPYDETKMSRISARLHELPFVNEVRQHEVEFSNDKARAIIYIDDKKASQFSGVVAVLPDNDHPGKINVAGDVRLKLQSAFGHAELFDLNWSNPLPQSQDLKVKFNYPFLFNTPFGLDAGLSLFKKDTTFLEFNRELGLQHFLQGNNYVKAYIALSNSDLISVKGYENATTLPPFADVKTTTYGLGAKYERVDYRLNPRKGVMIEGQGGMGTKSISRNSRINPEVYDSLDLHTTQYNGKGSADLFLPAWSRGVVNAGVMGGWLFSPDIFENELYRFGGLRTLRGFDEQSMNASQYIIGKLEYRYILEQNSYLFIFGNMAYYENRASNKFIHDHPYGYGGGITFETKLGIFSFTYALGKQFDNPVLLRDGKVHFGLVNYF